MGIYRYGWLLVMINDWVKVNFKDINNYTKVSSVKDGINVYKKFLVRQLGIFNLSLSQVNVNNWWHD